MITDRQPVLELDVVKALVALAAGYGWVEIDDPVIATATPVAAGLLFLGLTWWTRRKVTPTTDPRTNTGEQLLTEAQWWAKVAEDNKDQAPAEPDPGTGGASAAAAMVPPASGPLAAPPPGGYEYPPQA